MSDFESDLRGIINQHSRENGSNTPDFILAKYLNACLVAWDEATTAREKWCLPAAIDLDPPQGGPPQ